MTTILWVLHPICFQLYFFREAVAKKDLRGRGGWEGSIKLESANISGQSDDLHPGYFKGLIYIKD